MASNDTTEPLDVQTERIRVQFLERELDLTGTMIQLTRLEGTDEHRVAQAMRHISTGLYTIRKFIDQVSAADDRARITERLKQLEADAVVLERDLTTQASRNTGNH